MILTGGQVRGRETKGQLYTVLDSGQETKRVSTKLRCPEIRQISSRFRRRIAPRVSKLKSDVACPYSKGYLKKLMRIEKNWSIVRIIIAPSIFFYLFFNIVKSRKKRRRINLVKLNKN